MVIQKISQVVRNSAYVLCVILLSASSHSREKAYAIFLHDISVVLAALYRFSSSVRIRCDIFVGLLAFLNLA